MAARPNQLIPAWVWIALLIAVVAVPIAFSLSVPTSPRPPAPAAPTKTAAETPPASSDTASPPAPAPAPVGAETPGASEAERRALDSEMAALQIEKGAIETENARIRVKKEELEKFEQDHPNGVPPELFARYEADRATYNSDVKAFQSRVNVYTMKVADVERRLEALGPATP